jgi:serine/threonine protein kinase
LVPVESARGSSARRLEQLLGLLQLDSGERRERLRRIGRADPAAGAALEDLLAHHAAAMADGFLGDSPGQGDAPEGWIGPYQVVRELGHGGMGTVYLARRHEPYRQDVALKRMRPGLPEHLRSRFDAERQILATLIHPGIVRLLDGGTDADGSPYLVMEYVEGARLDEHCRERARGREERVRLVHAVAEAVAHAHRQGTVHRDLKPSNVLVGADGRPRVTDFGLAKLVATAAGGASATLTEAGLLLGTPPYMAPERLGLGPGRDEPGVDVYALGVMLFGLLVDRLPFESDDPLDGCVRAAREEAPPPRQVDPTVPRDLETITSRALARDPRDRFIDAGELAEQLRRYLAGEPLTIRPPSRAERLARWASRHRPALLASATSAGVVLVAAIVVLMAWNRDLHREQDALRSTIRSLWRSSARLFESVPPHNPAVRSFHDELARSFDAVLASGQLPAEPSLARQVAVMHRQLATSLEASGRSAEALEHLDRSIALLRPLPGRTDGGMVRAWTEFDLSSWASWAGRTPRWRTRTRRWR